MRTTGAARRLKLVFCGTPRFAVPTLEALLGAGHEIALVVSQPDRPVGRAQQLTAPPIKQTALAHGLKVTQPEKIRDNAEFRTRLEAIQPDAIVVVAYGRIIPPWMLSLPRLGCMNLHASLLPSYRGAAPIQWAVAKGDALTGNTTMLIDEGLDTGPILMQRTEPIGPEETAAELFDRLAIAGAPLVVETLGALAAGTLPPQPQNPELATYAPLLTREDVRMDFAARTAQEHFNRWRGFQPWPGAFTTFDNKKLIVHRMVVSARPAGDESEPLEPGRILVEGQRLFVSCAAGTWIEFLELQMEGKKRLKADEFLCGSPFADGALLG
jgi:methionyl-tRNA formyltransferase